MALLENLDRQTKMVMDLNGPEGNAYVILGTAHRIARQMHLHDQWPEIEAEMKSGNYKTLVETFDKYFGDVCDLILPDNWSDYQ